MAEPLRRWLSNRLAVALASLLIATVALWARGQQRRVTYTFGSDRHTATIQSEKSQLTLKWIVERPPSPPVNTLVVDGGMHLGDDRRTAIIRCGFTSETAWHGFGFFWNVVGDAEAAAMLPDLSRVTMVGLPHQCLWFCEGSLIFACMICRRGRVRGGGFCVKRE
jgi:hypothetical protein